MSNGAALLDEAKSLAWNLVAELGGVKESAARGREMQKHLAHVVNTLETMPSVYDVQEPEEPPATP